MKRLTCVSTVRKSSRFSKNFPIITTSTLSSLESNNSLHFLDVLVTSHHHPAQQHSIVSADFETTHICREEKPPSANITLKNLRSNLISLAANKINGTVILTRLKISQVSIMSLILQFFFFFMLVKLQIG